VCINQVDKLRWFLLQSLRRDSFKVSFHSLGVVSSSEKVCRGGDTGGKDCDTDSDNESALYARWKAVCTDAVNYLQLLVKGTVGAQLA
jgi:hypothetical protein